MSVQLARKRFTTAEYHQMIAAGVFNEDDRLELIEGEIVEMSPIGPRRVASVNGSPKFWGNTSEAWQS